MRRLVLAACWLVAAVVAVAQQPQAHYPQPRLQSVFPPGAQAGSTVEITPAGTDIANATALLFAHPGITAALVPPPADPPADPSKKEAPKKGPPPAAKFLVTVAPDVPPGAYDVRLVNAWGVSNPRLFVVGTLAEVNEAEPNNDLPQAQRVELGTVINGTLSSGTDVDYIVFAGAKGQRVLAHCATSSIDSKARPQVEIFGGPNGRNRLTSNRQYAGNDALADVTLPADGDYYVRVTEFAHQQGSADHFYRLTLSTGPWVDAVFPPMVPVGTPSAVTLYGRNLPGGQPAPGVTVDGMPVETLTVTVTPPDDPTEQALRQRVPPALGLLDVFAYRLPGANAVPIVLTTEKVVLEQENGNDRPEGAEVLPVPCEVAGRIDRPFDRDWYAFTAKQGEVVMIELFADRLGANIDPYLTIVNAATKQLIAGDGQLDDDTDSLHPQTFFTRSVDPPAYRFTAPADGQYLVLVASRDSTVRHGPQAVYRLRISPPQPDFRAVVMPRSRELPAAAVAPTNGETALDVFIDRRDGFNGVVTATAAGLPEGVTAKPAVIGHGQKWGTLVITGGGQLADSEVPLTIQATATIDGQSVTRLARPATITWGIPPQNPNIAAITRLDQQLILATRAEPALFRLAIDAATAKVKSPDGPEQPATLPLVVKPGSKVTLPVTVTWQANEPRPGPLQVQAEPTMQVPNQPPPVTVNNNQPVVIPPNANEAAVTIDVRANAAPGLYVLTLRGETAVKFARDPEGKDKKDVAVQTFAAPLEIQVIPTTLAKLSAQSPGNVKLGTTAEVTVRVERQFDFAGEFKVTLVFPESAAGLSAAEAVIPAGQSQVTVPVTVAEDAKVGAVNNIVVQAVAIYDGQYPTRHEAKLNLNVTK
jgi:hypothetical protein